MKQKVNIIVANPAGNITIFVLDKFPRSSYQSIASQLLAIEEYHAEQVAFITGENSMEMCGLEFCGNASRTFALILAHQQSLQGNNIIEVNVSGCSEPLLVAVNTESNYTKIRMPMPLSVETAADTSLPLLNGAYLVDFGGIFHVIVTDIQPTLENFNQIKDYISEKYNPPATGVMFYNTAENRLIPVVYVKDVDTTYFEGSCGSGATAVAAAFSQSEGEGTFSYTLPQPAGTITATVEKSPDEIKRIYIEGSVSYSERLEAVITLPEQ